MTKYDIIAHLGEARRNNFTRDGFTTAELAAVINSSMCTAQRRVKDGIANGTIVWHGLANRQSIHGVMKPVPVYVLVDPAPADSHGKAKDPKAPKGKGAKTRKAQGCGPVLE